MAVSSGFTHAWGTGFYAAPNYMPTRLAREIEEFRAYFPFSSALCPVDSRGFAFLT